MVVGFVLIILLLSTVATNSMSYVHHGLSSSLLLTETNLSDSVNTNSNASSVPNIPSSQFSALKDLYDANGGEHWRWAMNLMQVPWNFFSPDPNPCLEQWQGITCNRECTGSGNSSSFCVVIGLEIDALGLNGTLPDSIGDLQNLTLFKVAGNPSLQGSIPETISRMTSLQSLAINNNPGLNGSIIPDFFISLPKLIALDFQDCLFYGSFPSSIFTLNHLKYLSIANNRLTGTISSALCSLTAMETLFIGINRFTGSLPDCFNRLQFLNTFAANANQFTGTIPETLYSLTGNFVSLDLNTNHFHGTISTNILKLIHLTTFVAHDNDFTGTIPMLSSLKSLHCVSLYDNFFEGRLPFDNTISLTVLFLDRNYFTGSTTVFNTSEWMAVSFGENYITGPFPSYTNYSRTLLTEDLLERVTEVAPVTPLPGIVAAVVSSTLTANYSGNRFFYLGFPDNMLSGPLPDWLFTLPLIVYIYIEDNFFTGTIPPTYSYPPLFANVLNSTILAEFCANNNKLRGSIPPSLSDQSFLLTVRLAYNHLTGTIPKTIFENNLLMKEFSADNNLLTGPLPDVSFTDSHRLTTITTTNNELTGTIPNQLFSLKRLSLFAIGGNCFSGSLSEAMCNARYLQSLILDGLSTAVSCQERLFPNTALTSFSLKNVIQGTIPTCLFELPQLRSLYISGNELSGSLPENITLNQNIQNLRLSHNRLTGTIPMSIQSHVWLTLDLSFNKLRGHLSSSLNGKTNDISSSYLAQARALGVDQSLYLDINRLSGTIPPAIRSMEDISILNGNIFYCQMNRRQLPEHDPKASSYDCASDEIYQVMMGWSFILIAVVALILFLKWQKRNFMHNVVLPMQNRLREWNRAFEVADVKLNVMAHDGDESSRTSRQPSVVGMPIQGSKMRFRLALRMFRDLRKYSLWISITSVILLMPLYQILNLFESMFENKYAWGFSAIYMSGKASGTVLIVIFTVVIVLIYYLFGWKLIQSTSLAAAEVDNAHMAENQVTEGDMLRQRSPSRTVSIAAGLTDAKVSKYDVATILYGVLVFSINFITMTFANVVYVIIVVYEQEQAWIVISQLALAFIKVMWNEWSIWVVSYYADLFIQRYYYGRSENMLKKTVKQDAHIVLITCCLLFNNIVAPCLSIAFVSPSCFYNAFIAAKPITAYYNICDLYVEGTRGSTCISLGEEATTYYPPFIYSYNCSSLLPVNYIAVYMYMALVSGFIVPSLKVFFKLLQDYRSKEHRAANPAGLVMKRSRLERNLPLSLKPLYPHPSLICDEVSADCVEPRELSAALKDMPPIFHRKRTLVRVVGFFALLISFGIVFPPLGVVMALAIISLTYFEQLTIGMILYESEQAGYNWYREKLGYDVDGMVESMVTAVFPMMAVASMLFACLVFDTIGDKYGFGPALAAAILMSLVPGCVLLVRRIQTRFVTIRTQNALERQENIELQKIPVSRESNSENISQDPQINPMINISVGDLCSEN